MDKVNHDIMMGPQVTQNFKTELPKSEDVFHLLVAIQVLSTRFKTVWNKIPHFSSEARLGQTSYP